jgi:hypothetical protein
LDKDEEGLSINLKQDLAKIFVLTEKVGIQNRLESIPFGLTGE